MQLFFRIKLILVFLVCSFAVAFAANRDVIIGLDESGSMNGEKFQNLIYAIQLTASLLDESDRLYVIRGGGRATIEIDLSNKKREIESKLQRGIGQNGNTPECAVLKPAYDLMMKDGHREKIIILYGDGAWSTCGIEAQIVADFEKVKPKIIFFKIENSSRINSMSVLESNLSGIDPSGFTVYRNPANNSAIIKENLFKLSKTIIDADPSKIKPDISGNTIKFTSKFPLKKVLFIVQKDNCALNSTSLKVLDEVEISNSAVGGNLNGRYYEIASANKSVLPAGKVIEFNLDCPVDRSDVDIIPIVDMDLETEIEGKFLEADPIKKVYSLCEQEEEVTVKLVLTDDAGKKIDLTKLKGAQLEVSNGVQTKKLSISGNTASGTIALTKTTTYLTVEAKYEGYFQKKSKIITIKREECPLSIELDFIGNVEDRSADGLTISVCQNINELQVEAIIKDDKSVQQEINKLGTNVKLELVAGSQVKPMTIKGSKAFADLKIGADVLTVQVKMTIDGKAQLPSPEYTIRRVHCGAQMDTTVMDFGEVPMMEFVDDGKCVDEIRLIIMGSNNIVNPENYELSIQGVPREMSYTIDTLGDYFSICLDKKALLCDCFVRHGTFEGIIIATPKKNDGSFLPVEKKWRLTILPEERMWLRIKECFIIALILAFLCWYIWGLIRKPRFHSGAHFHFIEEDRNRRYGSSPEDEYWLKTAPSFKKYFWPYTPEKRSIGDDNLLIIASGSKNTVYLSRKSFTEKMKINGAIPDEDAKTNETISEKDTIRIKKSNTITVKYTFQIN